MMWRNSFFVNFSAVAVCVMWSAVGCVKCQSLVNDPNIAKDAKITIYGKSSDYNGLLPVEAYVGAAVRYALTRNIKLQEGTAAYRGIMVESGGGKVVVVVILGTKDKYPQHSLYIVKMDVACDILSDAHGYAEG